MTQVPRRGDETKGRILTAAASLLARNGYHATGINDILSLSKAPRGSLYFHFPQGKEQIATMALALASDALCEEMTTRLAQAQSKQEVISSLADLFKKRLEESGYHCGCPVTTVAMELSGTKSPVLATCNRAYAKWSECVAERLLALKIEDVTEERVTFAFSAILGAVISAQASRNTKPMDVTKTFLAGMI